METDPFLSGNLSVFEHGTNVTTMRSSSALKMAFDVVIKTTLTIIMLGMGAATEIQLLVKHIKRPVGVGIGMLSQFIVLPLATFGLAHALMLDNMPALGMLVMGCCPSGALSNVFTYWAKGDVPLSVSMTAVSNILAFGLMPLNLLIYSGSWTDENFVVPYINIFISFTMTISPVLLGIFLRWKLPKVALVIIKIGSIAGAVSVIVTLILLSLLYPFMYSTTWKIYIGAAFLPFIGFLFGYIVATIFRMEAFHRRTVAIETGIQNFPLCMTVLTLTFSKDKFAEIALFPLLYAFTTIIASVVFVIIFRTVELVREKMTRYKTNSKSSSEDTDVTKHFIEKYHESGLQEYEEQKMSIV